MINRRVFLAGAAAFGVQPVVVSGEAEAASTVYQTAKAKVLLTRVATGLDHPWALAFLPDGRALVTERSGAIRHISKSGVVSVPLKGVPAVFAQGQGGLLDLVVSPKFKTDRRLFMTFAEPRGAVNGTAVARAVLSRDLKSLTSVKVIWRQYPGYAGDKHYGSRIAFDRSGNLFVTTGERSDLRDEAQNPGNSLGKIVHITPDGGVPPNNPKKAGLLPRTWSIGHRNLQGAAIDPKTGALWTIEHGAMGGDELNQPKAGRNYGWPVISYGKNYDGTKIGEGTSKPGMEQPVTYWDPSIAPSGLAFYSGKNIPAWRDNIFLGALAGQRLVRLTMGGNKVVDQEALFQNAVGRVRDVREGPDGYLYIITDADAPGGSVYRISLAAT